MAMKLEPSQSKEPSGMMPVGIFITAVWVMWLLPNGLIALATVLHLWDIYYSIHLVYLWNTLIMPVPMIIAALIVYWFQLGTAKTVSHLNSKIASVAIPTASGVSATILIFMALVFVCGRIWATHIEPRLIQVRHIQIESSAVREPLRILHISDFQSAGIGSHERHAIRLMQQCKPHLIVHTGDVLQISDPVRRQRELKNLEALFQPLAAEVPMGLFNVEGDIDGPLLAQFRQGRGVMRLIESRGVELEAPDGTPVFLYGLTLGQSRFGQQGATALEEWLDSVHQSHPEAFSIAAGHAPDYILAAKSLPIDLCLAGHTHGGQVRLPFWGPLLWASAVPQTMARGFHPIGSTRINVSGGIGVEHIYGIPPIRFNCPPEMTLITVIPARSPIGSPAQS